MNELFIGFNSSVDTVGGFSNSGHEGSRLGLFVTGESSHQESDSVNLDGGLGVPSLDISEELVGISNADTGGTISQQVDSFKSGNGPSSLEGGIDVGTTISRELLAVSDGIIDIALSGLLETASLPGSNSAGVRENVEFSGFFQSGDGLGELLLDEFESVHSLAVGESESGRHTSRGIEGKSDFTSGETEKVALGSEAIEDLSGFFLVGGENETVDDGELVFNINDVVLESFKSEKLVLFKGESVQDGDDLVAGQSDDSVLDKFSQSKHILGESERFIQNASLFRSQDLGARCEGIFSNLELLI